MYRQRVYGNVFYIYLVGVWYRKYKYKQVKDIQHYLVVLQNKVNGIITFNRKYAIREFVYAYV